ncbi:unnamed protein product [Pedinophyceae sp. YPF-701]|nr:unnamed protein product [Pedinophyceae sp. YPF-701]
MSADYYLEDSLAAEILEINGRRYRVQCEADLDHQSIADVSQYHIREDPPGRWSGRVYADPEIMGPLIGTGGSTKRALESETGCTLRIPPRGTPRDDSVVAVHGDSPEAVATCLRRVAATIEQTVRAKRTKYNYFVSLPLRGAVANGARSLREAALADAAGEGVEEAVFVQPERLHVTVLMLKLYGEDKRAAAGRALAAACERIRRAGPLRVRIGGLEIMGGDPPEAAHVVYAGVRDAAGEGGSAGSGGGVKHACDVLVEEFAKAKLKYPGAPPLKLHATVLNSKYRGSDGGGASGRAKPCDVRGLLERHGAVELGECELAEAHVSERGRTDAESGYYACLHREPLS